jgi:F-type H+-transporting ATPase subunit delta
MAETTGIARPYADAVFQLAHEAGQLGGWSDALHAAALAVADDALARLIDRPDADQSVAISIIADVAGQAAGGAVDTEQLGNLVKLLAENGRLFVLADIVTLFDELKANVENSIDVVLTAAVPVGDAQKATISTALKKRFGRDINLHFQLDENLIGGARLQAGDLVIDGSIRTGLAKLASTLTN